MIYFPEKNYLELPLKNNCCSSEAPVCVVLSQFGSAQPKGCGYIFLTK